MQASKRGSRLKSGYFTAISVKNSCRLIITSTGDGLFRFINIDDLERP